MKCKSLKNLPVLILFIFTSITLLGQSFSPEYFRDLKVSSLSDYEVIKIKTQLERQNQTLNDLENVAISSGMTPADFLILKTRIESVVPAEATSNVEAGVTIPEQPIEMDKNSGIGMSDIFGSEIFNNTHLNFEPNPNIIPSGNYIVGPGDEFGVVIYGMQEFSSGVHVNKEGKVSIPVVGQIYVNGLTFEAAKQQIKKACSRIYSSLGSGQSSISITITKFRSIKITILGCRNPGNYTVSSLSTVFNALHVCGGPDKNGSFRNIELIRNNKVIKKIDIYKFLTAGDQSDNVNLQDYDIIRIPIYENRVRIEGNVKRPGIFELLPNETFFDLLRYCSGFTESAYKSNIKLVQNTEKELRITDLSEADYKNYTPKLGDVFKVSTILNRFENKVSIKGSVFRPDDYALVPNMTLLDLIKKADGLTEDAFTNRSILIRQKADLTKELITVDLNAVLNGSKNITLQKNDEIVVNSIFDFKGQETVTIYGHVKNTGEYPFIQNLTLYDLILQAGGFTIGASKTVEIASIIIKDEKKVDQVEKSIIQTIEIDSSLMDQSKNIALKPFDVVSIRKKPVFEANKIITIVGEVMFPGNYAMANNNEKILDYLNRSGGLLSSANTDAIYIRRRVDDVSTFQADGVHKKIPIDYNYIVKHPNSSKNLIVKNEDEIFVEKIDNTVKIFGNVFLNSEIPYTSGKGLKYYVKSVGGFKRGTDKKRIYIVKANGLGDRTKSFLFFRNYPKIPLGCEIHVPEKKNEIDSKNELSIVELSVIAGVVGSLTTMALTIFTIFK